ncbi:MAG: TIGR01212 family radical SAM protein [Proteobacteria bacterium]|nr:TIGR01212 family radical SAM protein [Pseudomonadota bacterium]
MHNKDKPYYPLSAYLRERYGCKVYKITLDIGLTCPNRDGTVATGGCLFCETETLKPLGANRESSGGNSSDTITASIEEQIEVGIERLVKRHGAKKYIAYFNINSSTYADVGFLKEAYSVALDHPEIVGVAVSTRPDCVGEEVVELLAEIARQKDVWVELGLQSASDSTLKLINRGHTVEAYERAVERLHSAGLKVCTHIIAGLPGETEEEYLDTVRLLASQSIWGVKLHQLQIVAGTGMEELYKNGGVEPLTIEKYAGLVAKALALLPKETVIHRLSGDLPDRFIVAPKWGANKFLIADKIAGVITESAL